MRCPATRSSSPATAAPASNDQHPPCDIRAGEQLIADVYGWIKASPAFAETLLIITYDEHGGCYDHVAPPGGARNPDRDNRPGQDGFKFNRFGVRVPSALVVNPHIRRGLVARPAGRTPFDHTSIIKTVQQCLGSRARSPSATEAAPDFSGLPGLDAPRTDNLPVVQPLPFEPAAAPSSNDLHHLDGRDPRGHDRLAGTRGRRARRVRAALLHQVFGRRGA